MMKSDFQASAKRVIEIETRAIEALSRYVDVSFDNACQLLMECQGKVVVTGMGKSGHIANKIAATLASTGTPAFYMHPGEASHGDLGMLSTKDCIIAISNSGETQEILGLLPVIKRLAVPCIAMTASLSSSLAAYADVTLCVNVEQEACSLGLAPTSSTTATLVMGDALAVALLDAKGFTSDDFALSHPGGSLGKKLLLQVEDIMCTGDELPLVDETASISDSLLEISKKGLGFTGVVNQHRELVGVFTDGDLRRVLDNRGDLHNTAINQVMTPGGKTTYPHTLAVEALNKMEKYNISALLAVDKNNNVVGALNMHMLLKAGVL